MFFKNLVCQNITSDTPFPYFPTLAAGLEDLGVLSLSWAGCSSLFSFATPISNVSSFGLRAFWKDSRLASTGASGEKVAQVSCGVGKAARSVGIVSWKSVATEGGWSPPDPSNALIKQHNTIWWYDYQWIMRPHEEDNLDSQRYGTKGFNSAKPKLYLLYAYAILCIWLTKRIYRSIKTYLCILFSTNKRNAKYIAKESGHKTASIPCPWSPEIGGEMLDELLLFSSFNLQRTVGLKRPARPSEQ